MAERHGEPGGAAHRKLADGSRGFVPRLGAAMRDSDRFGLALTALAGVGALLLVISEFSTIAAVDVAHGSCKVINDADRAQADRCVLSGFERHGGAFLLLGLLALAMAWG